MGQPLSKQQKELLALINNRFKDDKKTIEIHPYVFMEQENAHWQSVFHKTLVLVTLRTLTSNLQSKGYLKVKFKKDVWAITKIADKPKTTKSKVATKKQPESKAKSVTTTTKVRVTKNAASKPELKFNGTKQLQAQAIDNKPKLNTIKETIDVVAKPTINETKPVEKNDLVIGSRTATTKTDEKATTEQSINQVDNQQRLDNVLAQVFQQMDNIGKASKQRIFHRQQRITVDNEKGHLDNQFEHLIKH